MRFRSVIFITVLLAITSSAIAQKIEPFLPAQKVTTPSAITDARSTPEPFSIARLFSVIFALIVSVALIYFLAYVLKRFLARSRQIGPQGSFQILGHLYLNPRQILYMIAVADRILVIAVTDNNVTTLSEIADQETVTTLKNEALVHDVPSGDFVHYLKRAFAGKG